MRIGNHTPQHCSVLSSGRVASSATGEDIARI
jgi:hypothetical protein